MSHNPSSIRDLLTKGLIHEDRFVRETCLNYWEMQPYTGAEQARRIIDALYTFGLQAFTYPHQAYRIPLDHAHFERLIDTLLECDRFDDTDLEHFGRWFKWCLSVEDAVLPELEAFLKSERALAFEGNGFVHVSELLDSVKWRRQYKSLDAAACHAGIEKVLTSIEAADGFPHDAVADVLSLLDQLVRTEAHGHLAELATTWLTLDPRSDQEVEASDCHNWIDDYKFGFGVYLAGRIKLISGVDRIIDGISQVDWDWLNETSQQALCEMTTPETIARLRQRWWDLPESGRLYLSDVFLVAHLPEHRDFYLENMQRKHRFETIPYQMACALALLGDADALRQAGEYWEANAYDPEATEVAEFLYAIHRLRDEKPPVIEAIHERLIEDEEHTLKAREHMAELSELREGKGQADPMPLYDARQTVFPDPYTQSHSAYQAPLPVVRTSPKIGRNEPCPCGSGKKYKKCCLNK